MSDKMPDAWIVPSASGDGYLCTLSHVNLPGWNRYVPAARIAELEAALAAERERREAAEAVIHTCQWAMRQPLDGWKGECERKALDEARAHFARHKD